MGALLTPAQIADYLGVKLSTIYQWTHQGYIPHVKLGRLVRFDLRVIEQWLKRLSDSGRAIRRLDIKEFGL